MRALAIAATGMDAQQTNLEVIANNIANINTTGVQARARGIHRPALSGGAAAGRAARGGENPVPEGAQIGLGVRTAAIRNLHMQGALAQTGNRLDLALNGRGWFQVTGADGETLYTRAGAFNTNANGELVTLDGYQVEPAITVPPEAVDVVINESGQVYARVEPNSDLAAPRATEPRHLRQRRRPGAARRQSLPRDDRRPARPRSASRPIPGIAKIHQGYLESSNVDPVKEITQLISAQRAYEMNSKVIQAADEMAGTISKGMR